MLSTGMHFGGGSWWVGGSVQPADNHQPWAESLACLLCRGAEVAPVHVFEVPCPSVPMCWEIWLLPMGQSVMYLGNMNLVPRHRAPVGGTW